MQGQEAKYQKVVAWVRQNIENGTFRPGDRLMSENELSEKFGLSRQTIRRATGELVKQNLVTRLQGSGTYIGSQLPDSLQSDNRRFMNIAVISTFNESYIFPGILKGIAGELTEQGFATQVFFTDNRLYREQAILEQILEMGNIDGLIVEPVKSALPNPNISLYRKFLERKIPVIFFNTFYRELKIPCVRIDDSLAARMATQILLDAGHDRIGGIFKADDGQGPLRYLGYLSAMREARKQPEQDSVLWIDTPAAADMSDYADYLFERIKGCTGIVCYNDQVAYQLIQLALDRNIRVPEDLSVVGIDDSYLAGVCKVPFTSILHPKEQLGRKVAENLLKMIRDPLYDGNCLMDVEPVLRDSVAEIRHE